MIFRRSIAFLIFWHGAGILCFAQADELALLDSLRKEKLYAEIVELGTSMLDRMDKQDSNFTLVTQYRANANQELNQYAAAIPDWVRLIERLPSRIDYYNSLAYAFWATGKSNEACKVVEKAYEIDQESILTLSNLAYFKAENMEFNESVKYANIGLRKKNLSDKQKGLLLSNRSFGYLGKKKYKKAEKDATISIEYFPANSFAFYFRAVARLALNKRYEACSDLERSRELGAVNLTSGLLNTNCF